MRLRLIHAWALVVSVGACSFDSGGVPDDDVSPDADDDVPADAPGPDAQCGGQAFTFAVANLGECAIPLARGDIVFAAGTVEINTSTGRVSGGGFEGATQLATQSDGGTGIMVISGVNVTVPAASTLVVRGARPLAIVASGNLTIAGTIDASGTLSSGGPGADLGCQASAGPDGFTQLGSNAAPGGTGGGGGAYATDGGTGAHVSPEPVAAPDTPGGEQHTDVELSPIHGGCGGGTGGVAIVTDVTASGGGGGGLELVGGVSIVIEGVVSASGGGGGGAAADGGGGGGGGSGGAILIQTPSLRLDAAKLTANGGAGGEGARNTGGGSPGQDGSLIDATEATGGTGVAGGNGGNGAVMMDDGKPAEVGTGSTTATAGGGGGGGGMGRIHLRVLDTVTKIGSPILSPPETSSTL